MATKKKTTGSRKSATPATKKIPARKPAAKAPAKKAAAKPAPAKKTVKAVAKAKAPAKAPVKAKAKPAPVKAKAKPAPVKKSAAKAPAKKTLRAVAKKTPAKAPAKKASPKKSLRAVAKKTPAKPVVKKAPAKAPAKKAPPKKSAKASAFNVKELTTFRLLLQNQLMLIQGNLDALAGDNLKRTALDNIGDISSGATHLADHGTDNFDREFALSLASTCQDSIYAIMDAIRRIDAGEYGVCQSCDKPIERARLKALPFAKKCVICQSADERSQGGFQAFQNIVRRMPSMRDDSMGGMDS